MKTINPEKEKPEIVPKITIGEMIKEIQENPILLDDSFSIFAPPQNQDVMSWCSRCGKWHPDNTLTLCKLLSAKELLDDRPKQTKIEAPNAPKGWKKL